MRLSLLLVVLLTACAPTLAERQASLDATCRGYGFTPNTDAYRQCWMQVDQAQRARAAGAGPVICAPAGNAVVCN
jgi:hypothetical protein